MSRNFFEFIREIQSKFLGKFLEFFWKSVGNFLEMYQKVFGNIFESCLDVIIQRRKLIKLENCRKKKIPKNFQLEKNFADLGKKKCFFGNSNWNFSSC